MRFFLDNNVSYRFAKALGELVAVEGKEHEVIHLTERFKPDAKDIEWIPVLEKEGGWIVISGDRFRKNERRIFVEARLTTFFFSKSLVSAKYWEQAHRLVKRWPEIMEIASSMTAGSLFEIPFRLSGRFKPL